MPLGHVDLFFDQIKVIEQPFSGRCDPPAVCYGFGQQGVDSNQNLFILRQSHEKGITPAAGFDESREEAHEAKILGAELKRMIPRVKADRMKKQYLDALHQLATLREPVDKFFDKVMVMVDDERVRANRLAMLQTLLKEFSTIADFSEIVTEGKSSN